MATTQRQMSGIFRREGVGDATLPPVVNTGQSTRWRSAKKLARVLWCALRDWCGDSAYERYLRAFQKVGSPSCPPLSREKFYVEQLNRRYSRPNRCC